MRRRLLLSTLGVVAVAILVLGLPLLIVTVRLISDVANNDLLRETQAVQAYVEDRIGLGEISARRLARLVPAGQQVRVTLPSGAVVNSGPRLGKDTISQSAPVREGGRVEVARPAAGIRQEQLSAGILVFGLALLSAAAAAGVAVLSARRLSGPLLDVADRAARLGAGDFRLSPTRHGVPELDRVSDVLDRSANEIAELVRRERDLASDVSHQLRTRLTALQMRLEEIALSDDADVRTEAVAALEQAERLSGVVNELLAQARHARAAGAEVVDVAQELHVIVAEHTPAIARAGRSVDVVAEPGLVATATPGRLHQAVGALVDNALQHGAGSVRVTAHVSGTNVVVEVTDEGTGVAPDLVPRLFERGVSGSNSTGLGLALARALVEADGGRLELRRSCPPVFAVYLARPELG